MSALCFIDTETTGLDPRIHQPYEVSWWLEHEAAPRTIVLAHSLDLADGAALKIGRYFERDMHPFPDPNRDAAAFLARELRGVTLVGSNPSFDAAMLTRVVGTAVWHHRMIDVANMAMVVFNAARPPGLAQITETLRNDGYEIPEPDHTAEGDVRTTRAVYKALVEWRAGLTS